MKALCLALLLTACSSSPAVQRHALDSDGGALPLGSPCDVADCAYVNGVWACPACGVGNTCAVAGQDPNDPTKALTTCQGPVCGNGNVVCDPGMRCDNSGDCLPPCLVGGVEYHYPGTNCGQAGLPTGVDGSCIVTCYSFACSLLGGSC